MAMEQPITQTQRDDRQVLRAALALQRSLMPHALATLAVGAAIYFLAGSWSSQQHWMLAGALIFGIAAIVMVWARNVLNGFDFKTRKQQLIHLASGLVWALAVLHMALFASISGPAEESLLFLATGAAALCFLFSAPSLLMILVVGPAAAAGPLWFFMTNPDLLQGARLAWAAVALVFAISLMLNRMIETHLRLWIERERLLQDRAAALARAESLARLKSGIVATLSHEVRNGLQGVIHVLGAATGRNGRTTATREHLTSALESALELQSVLEATLDAERAEAGALSITTSAFDILEPVAGLADLYRVQAASKGLSLSVVVDPEFEDRDQGQAVGDPARVRQLLHNLVSNAVKYTQRGQVEIRLEQFGKEIRICVVDSGPGMSAEELETAFQPFRRLERTSAGQSGAGLGLSLTRELAELMSGRIEVTSAPGIGSSFVLVLPYDPSVQRPLRADRTADPAPDAPHLLKVLVASENPLNLAMLRKAFEQLGHSVLQSSSGQRAIDLLAKVELDLVVLDSALNDFDLPQCLGEIRTRFGNAVPIIGFMGMEDDDAKLAIEAGASAILRRPTTSGATARAIEDALAARGIGNETGRAA